VADRPSLSRLIEEARARVAAMSPEERAAMHAEQRESWVRGEAALSAAERKTTVMKRPGHG
jgi:hypothetical protein